MTDERQGVRYDDIEAARAHSRRRQTYLERLVALLPEDDGEDLRFACIAADVSRRQAEARASAIRGACRSLKRMERALAEAGQKGFARHLKIIRHRLRERGRA
ncbi:hypothetical protein [Rhodoplanes serenus]|uniref:hypothetical protein n=1 Tax=Rhodoplanes serenus TaxID=200615 RepID=UPI001478081E|nr:hypothetical protein [Rhodoplanes serenus]